jgi:hypothetical protein
MIEGMRDLRGSYSQDSSKPMDIARCFLRVSNIHDELLERINRYETALWRQVKEILLLINAIGLPRPPMQF